MAQQDDATARGVVDDIRGDATAREERAAAARVLESVALPVGDLNAALPQLRRPFAREAVKFKVQTVFGKPEPKGCVIVSYIDARLVIERLNAVCGGAWTMKPQRVADKSDLLWCELEVFGQSRPDLGESSKGMSKDLWSDALKRAAVQFGVAVSVYALPEIKLFANQPHVERRMKWDPKTKSEKPTLVLTELGHQKLREGYQRWLDEVGITAFGPVLDHGDVEGAVVDEEPEEFAPAAPPALTDDKAEVLTAMARSLYASIAAVDGAARQFPPAQFAEYLRRSAHSHEELEKLVAYVRERRDQLVGGVVGS